MTGNDTSTFQVYENCIGKHEQRRASARFPVRAWTTMYVKDALKIKLLHYILHIATWTAHTYILQCLSSGRHVETSPCAGRSPANRLETGPVAGMRLAVVGLSMGRPAKIDLRQSHPRVCLVGRTMDLFCGPLPATGSLAQDNHQFANVLRSSKFVLRSMLEEQQYTSQFILRTP